MEQVKTLDLATLRNAGIDIGSDCALNTVDSAGIARLGWNLESTIPVALSPSRYDEDEDLDFHDSEIWLGSGSAVQSESDGEEDAMLVVVNTLEEEGCAWTRWDNAALAQAIARETLAGGLLGDYLLRVSDKSEVNQRILREEGHKSHEAFVMILLDPESAEDFDHDLCQSAISAAIEAVSRRCARAAADAETEAERKAAEAEVEADQPAAVPALTARVNVRAVRLPRGDKQDEVCEFVAGYANSGSRRDLARARGKRASDALRAAKAAKIAAAATLELRARYRKPDEDAAIEMIQDINNSGVGLTDASASTELRRVA